MALIQTSSRINRDEITLVCSRLVFEETEPNIARKAPGALSMFRVLQDVLDAELVTPSRDLVEQTAGLVHIKDAPIVAAAAQSGTQWLATYDRKHLLAARDLIREHFGIVTATPDEILGS